ncbi:hypothetical protein A1O3_00792 [Capronia epimyces CBS 606.96]|uniref:Uncharacterized protein n=1 Tax=Capronia epimyces CBS 606.96 TaxID=1182542 RepID=W9YH64_9EURO|nr:uncharacterized protein A1O3_00792 [Capronia epimyces CBS 606.96]EXJ92242.1 hypothetical protein A1O3_00792 [Capronia epimyces CBS 606.96]
MEDAATAPADKDLPFTPLDQRLQAGGAPSGARFERHVKPSSWRAHSLRRPYLLSLLILSLALLGGIEVLRQLSHRRHGFQRLGGLNPTRLTTGQNILYSYIPTVTAVLYSILWSYIDSDTKRLEPYIQMRSSRSPASNLLLDYVFESAFATPVRALRRRHWTLAAVSTTFLLISLILPASQGALFGIDHVSYWTDNATFDLSHKYLVSGTLAGGEFVDQAKAISVSDGSELPSWTTAEYAATAFSPKTGSIGGNETWTTRSVVYYAQPSCRRFELENEMLFDGGASGLILGAELVFVNDLLLVANLSIADAPSCYLTVGIMIRMFEPLSQDDYLFPIFTHELHAAVATSGITAVSVQRPQPGDPQYNIIANLSTPVVWREPADSCPDLDRLAGIVALDFSKFNVSWALPWTNNTSNIGSSVALYDFTGQSGWATADVTVDANAQAVVSIDQLESQTLFSNDEFNMSVFESYLEHGRIQPRDILKANASNPGLWAIGYNPSLGDVVVSNLTSQVIQQSSYPSLLSGDSVGDAFEAGYRLIFALMFNEFLQLPAAPETVAGSVHIDTFAVVVVPAFAIMSEALLALAAVMLIALAIGYHRRTSILRSDPDSIAAQCSIIVDEFNDVGIMRSTSRNLELLSTRRLEEELRHSHLEYNEGSGYLRLVTPEQELAPMAGPSTPSTTETVTRGDPLPFFMSKRGVILAVTALVAILAALIFLAAWSHLHHGFDYLTNSLSFRSQLFWSFMPTLIATFIEASWGSLHRDLSVLETWAAIRKRQTRAQESLSLRYSSRPPSLVFWMASKRRHFLLAFVSFLCLTTGILNIAMAGLFLPDIEDFTSSVDTVSQYTSTALPGYWVDQNDVNQAFSVLRAQLSDGGNLPSWTSHNLSFVPVVSNASAPVSFVANLTSKVFGSTTSAIGSSLDCVDLPNQATLNGSGPGIFTDSTGGQSVRFRPETAGVGVNQTCTATYDFNSSLQSIFFQAMELLDLTNGSTSNLDLDGCGGILLLVSGEASTQTISMYVCSSSISTSDWRVQYDADQTIISQQAIDTASSHGTAVFRDAPDLLSFYRSKFMLAASFSLLGPGPTTEYDWPGLLMTRVRNSSTIRSIPQLAADVWTRVFAIWFSLFRDNLLVLRNEGDASFSAPTGTVTLRQSRIMPSIPAFVVSILLIFLYLVGFIVVIWRRRHRYAGPRMPNTIGSIIPWVIHSTMLDDFAGVHYVSSRDRDAALQRMGRRYGFGRFRGRHGRVTLGIEYEELLMASGAYGDF